MKLLIVFSICVVFGLAYKDENENFRIIDSLYQELPCSRQGGICTIAVDCPRDRKADEQGLCPEQRSRGVECCYGPSIKETRCQKLGGACMEGKTPCAPQLIYKEATDCEENTTCCIITH